jgi:hypothetical protein
MFATTRCLFSALALPCRMDSQAGATFLARSGKPVGLMERLNRSLEKYLVDAIQAFKGLGEADALKAIAPLKFVHVYGDVGRLGPVDATTQTRPYNPTSSDALHVSIAQTRLRLMGDRPNAAGGDKDEVTDLVGWAHTLCFLGFGYDRLNLTRLGFARPARMKQGDSRHFCGTLYGLGEAEISKAISAFPQFDRRFLSQDCEAFLRNSGVLCVTVGACE